MFKRVTWFGLGVAAGAVASKWVEVKARRRLARYFPQRRLTLKPSPEVAEVADRARELAAGKVADLRHAFQGGRSAMVEKEAELRRQLRLVEPGESPAVGRRPGARPPGQLGQGAERLQSS
jgi:hypothetical protein